jgi:hypothetical protein
MRIPNKFNGYSADNRRLYNMGGGGGGPNTTYSNTSNIPEYAQPYVEQMLGATQRQLFTGSNNAQGAFTPTGFNNFTPYGATYQKDASGNPIRDATGNLMYTNTAMQQAQAAVAPQSAGQQMATNAINQYVAPSQTGGASAIAGDVAGRSAASGYYSPLRAERFQLGRPDQIYANQVRSDSFTAPFVSQAYMSPYMQNVVNTQQREAMRQSNIAKQQQQAQAVGQGAFGGSRQGIVEAERQRNLATQLGDIQGMGLQQAYGAGQQQFNAEQAAYLQAQQANQQAGLTAQQANQQANMQTGVQNLQSQLQAQAAQEASRQFGAQLGLQGYGQSLQAAQTLGQLGQQQYQQDMGTIQAMAGMGAQEQAQTQRIIDQAMQNYGTAQQYPLMQLGVMSNMLRGLPMQSSTTNMYQAQPSMLSQAAGAVGTGLGLVQQYNTAFPGKKEGGVVKMANGGLTPSGGITSGANRYELNNMYKKFSDGQLGKALDDPEAQREKQRRDALRASMANGGIIAFKKGEGVEDKERIEAEKNKPVESEMYPVPERKTTSRPITALYNPDQGADNATKDRLDKIVEQRKQIDAKGNRILAERDIKDAITSNVAARERTAIDPQRITEAERAEMIQDTLRLRANHTNESMNKKIAAASANVSPIPKASAAPAADTGIDAAFKPVELSGKPNMQSASATMRAAQGDNQGIKTLDSDEQADADLNKVIGGMDTKRLELEGIANKPTAEFVAGYQKDRESINLPDPAQKQRERRDERKTRGEADEVQAARNNLIQFLTKWGTTPGSALRGFTAAGVDLVEKMDLDRKTRQRFLNEIDEIDSQIDSAEYARRLGDENRAQAEKKAAGENAWKLQHDIAKMRLDIALKNRDVQKVLESTKLKMQNQHLKGDEYGTEITYQGLIALPGGKYPPGPVTRMIASQIYQKSKPGVQSTLANLGYHEATAGAAVTNAITNIEKATTEAGTAKGNQAKLFQEAFRIKTMTGAGNEEITKARKEDPTGKKGLVKAIEDRVTQELLASGNYPLLVKPAATPKKDAAPAKPVEPKKDDKKGGGWGELKVK